MPWGPRDTPCAPLPPHAAILVQVSGGLEYDSFCEFSIEISSAGGVPIAVDDIQLELPLALQHARYMVGMGVEGVDTYFQHRRTDAAFVQRADQDRVLLQGAPAACTSQARRGS